MLEEYKAVIAEEGVVIEVRDDMGHLISNPTQVYQLFANLIGNALEHARNERLVVEVSYLGQDEAGAHHYLVRDNGSGIPENLLGRLFLPFVSEKAGGGGVGLAIVHAIVRIHGGSIRGYNDENGACFEFTMKDLSQEANDF